MKIITAWLKPYSASVKYSCPKPDNWDEIFAVYSGLAQRQENLKPLLPLRIAGQNRDANFEIVNYSDEIIQAKKNATEYFYAHALSLLARNNKPDARLAHDELKM